MKLNNISFLCYLLCFFYYFSTLAMEEKKDSFITRAIKENATSFMIGVAPLIPSLLEYSAPSSTLTKISCVIIPYISFIILTLEALYFTTRFKYIPTNNKATLCSTREHKEKIDLHTLIKNQPRLKLLKKITQKLSINPHSLMVHLGEDETSASFNFITIAQNFNKQLCTRPEKNAVLGHELCHIHDKVCHKMFSIYCLIPLLTDSILLGLTAYINSGIPATEAINILQKNWFTRMLLSYGLNFPGIQFPLPLFIARYYEKKADIVSTRLGNNAGALSNYFYKKHIELRKKFNEKTLLGFDLLTIFQFVDDHPSVLDRACYLADIAIKEQHTKPCDLMLYNRVLAQRFKKSLELEKEHS